MAGRREAAYPEPMRHARWLALLVLFVAPGALAQDGPSCVESRAIARWAAAGYNHWVRVENGCDRRVRCQVSTSVSSERHTVTVAPGAAEEVLTFRGSPASEFTPRVDCAYVD